ncbi:MAG TPA: MarR family transcriptional regulator [Ktedonobacterales bacterium]
MAPRASGDGDMRDGIAVAQSGDQDSAQAALSKLEFERLAALRHALRQFSRQTEIEARRIGLTPQQYMLLLAVKGFPGRETATITELAEQLQIRHNAVIGLVNRAEDRGLVAREPGAPGEDRRIVRVRLTAGGEAALQRLAFALRDERQRMALAVTALDEAQRA